jgi:UDP-sugar transporter A1/2/3
LAQEGSKLIISLCFLVFSGAWCEATYSWTLRSALLAAGVPGTLYVIQNYCNIMANQFLPPVTFSVLNQTKILSTALCCFLLMGQKQSRLQFVALIVLVIAILIIQKGMVPCQSVTEGQPKEPGNDNLIATKKDIENLGEIDIEESSPLKANVIDKDASSKDPKAVRASKDEAARLFTMGVLPALFASFLSGLAGTLSQKTLQLYNRSPHLFNVELAIVSSSFLIVTLMLGSPDCQKIKDAGVTQGWTWKTWIPIVTSSLGGMLVGLVTQYHGAVVKGFTMIFGMAISGILQQLTFGQMGGGVTKEQFVGGCVGAFSLWMHASFPAEKTS